MYYEKLVELGIRIRRRSGQEKVVCPKCSESRRNKKDPCLSVNITEGSYCCHNCSWKGSVRDYDRREQKKAYFKPDKAMIENQVLNEKIISYAIKRGISENTLKKFLIYGKEEFMPQKNGKANCMVFPYIRNGEVVNAKFRSNEKHFKLVKDAELIFFGMQTLENRHCAIIVEGEWDALAMYEAGFGNDYEPVADEQGVAIEHDLGRWAVLSVPNGASKGSNKLEYLDNCAEWISHCDEFVIAVDCDEAGDALRDELVRRLGVEKCRILNYPVGHVIPDKDGVMRGVKDANEVLIKYGKDRLIECVIKSKFIPISGIYFVEDIFPVMLASFKKGIELAPTTRMGEMDDYFRWKKGDINTIVGYGNHGKTFFWLQMMLIKSIYDGWKWAVFSPENYPANDFFDDLVEMYVGKLLGNMSEDEYTAACNFLNDHFFYVYPEDDHDIETIHDKFRFLILKKGVDGVLVDPFNQLDKNQKAYERDDQYLSRVLKDIKRFALLNAVSYNIITHPNKPNYQADKSLPVVDMYDLNGGSMWGNKSDQIISYYRPQFHVDKKNPSVEVYFQKVKRKRTGGNHGSIELVLKWECKRYADLYGNIPCDPNRANKILPGEKLIQRSFDNWLPHKDENGDEVGF